VLLLNATTTWGGKEEARTRIEGGVIGVREDRGELERELVLIIKEVGEDQVSSRVLVKVKVELPLMN
jgi:hypothetical protein